MYNMLTLRELSIQIERLTNSLKLMGVHTSYVGFSPAIVREMIYANIDLQGITVHANFRAEIFDAVGGNAFYKSGNEIKRVTQNV